MRRNQTRKIAIYGIVLALYLVLALVIPFPRTAAYWVAFAFGLLAICAQIWVMRVAFENGAPIKSKFYGVPVARMGVIYLAAQLILSFALMGLGFAFRVPVFAALPGCVLLFGVCALGFFGADIVRGAVEQVDDNRKANTRAILTLQSKAAAAAELPADPETKKLLTELAEKFRYADPVSSEATEALDADLNSAVDALRSAVEGGDFAAAKQLCGKIEAALSERNRLCRLNK